MRGLWRKSIGDAWPLCLSLAALLFVFLWIYVWLSSLVDLGAFGIFLHALPPVFEKLAGISFATVATPAGRVAVAFIDPVVLMSAMVWSITRGSDVVSGEIGRGTMEMLLAQPIPRAWIVVTHALASTIGALLLCVAAWLGTWAGLAAVGLDSQVDAERFIPSVLNLFGLMFFLTALTTLISCGDSFRWRTIGIMGGFYVVELIVKIVARVAPGFEWLSYFSFHSAFEPQVLAVKPDDAWWVLARYDAALVGLGLAAYVAALVVFSRRDIPPPL